MTKNPVSPPPDVIIFEREAEHSLPFSLIHTVAERDATPP
jgi:hypothetical protein